MMAHAEAVAEKLSNCHDLKTMMVGIAMMTRVENALIE